VKRVLQIMQVPTAEKKI